MADARAADDEREAVLRDGQYEVEKLRRALEEKQHVSVCDGAFASNANESLHRVCRVIWSRLGIVLVFATAMAPLHRSCSGHGTRLRISRRGCVNATSRSLLWWVLGMSLWWQKLTIARQAT